LEVRAFSVGSKAKDFESMIIEKSFKIFNLCEDKFDIGIEKIGIEKMDIFIAPEFVWVAMENHGLIFLSEKLFNDEKSACCMLAHEIVHHWIGNYVSFPTWIKEGITRYYEYVLTAKIYNMKPSEFTKIFTTGILKVPKKPIEEEFQKTYDYSEALRWFVFLTKKIGIETFEKNLRKILKEHGDGFVSEENFMDEIQN
jgi:aminopeptidase N